VVDIFVYSDFLIFLPVPHAKVDSFVSCLWICLIFGYARVSTSRQSLYIQKKHFRRLEYNLIEFSLT